MDMFFFFNDTATTEIYTLSLHDALPIWVRARQLIEPIVDRRRFRHDPPEGVRRHAKASRHADAVDPRQPAQARRSEEHTSELQSRQYLVCRLLLEKKQDKIDAIPPICTA